MRNLIWLAALFVTTEHAHAAVITDPSQLQGSATVIDFENVNTNGQLVTSLSNPVTLGGATFTSLTGQLSIFDISLSGGWPRDLVPVSSKTLFPGGEPDSAISLTFVTPVAEVLIGWGDPDFPGNRLQAFDVCGNLLEQAVPQLDPNQVTAVWIGFSRTTSDIAKIIVLPDQSMPSGDEYVIDNIYFSTSAVPEPAALAIWGGIVLVGLVARLRHPRPGPQRLGGSI